VRIQKKRERFEILGFKYLFSKNLVIGFYGLGFPPKLTGKEFIYRGMELEKLGDFLGRIQSQYPGSELLKSTEQPSPDIKNSPGKYLLISSVNPFSEEEVGMPPINKNKKLPLRMEKYLKMNEVNVFLYSKPYKKNAKKGGNEFQNLWTINLYLYTKDTFPHYKRRSEVIKRKVIDLSPIENAMNSILSKNNELLEIIQTYTKNSSININPFTMALNGVIDAAVNGGLANFYDTFFTPEYSTDHPEYAGKVTELRNAINDQVKLLTEGLQLHGKICSVDMHGMQEKLETFFEKMQAELSQSGRRKKIMNDEGNGSPKSPIDPDKWKKVLGMK